MSNYYISKDEKSGEIVYLEYNKKGYQVKPKTKKKDAIEVNKIIFVSPDLTKKLLKKKIDLKVTKLMKELKVIDDDSEEGTTRVRNNLIDAERLKLNVLNNYANYLGGSYSKLTIKKLQVIIDEFRKKLYRLNEEKQKKMLIEMMMSMNRDNEPRKGKGR